MTTRNLHLGRYVSYLVRIWREPGSGVEAGAWRSQITDVATGQRRGFGSLEALLAYLQDDVQTRLHGEPHNPKED